MAELTPEEITAELLRLSRLLDERQEELVRFAREWAHAERDYRLARATAYKSSSGTVAERQAAVDAATIDQMHRAHESDALRQAALEAVRNARAQLSAVQSIANAVREEMKLSMMGVT